MKPNFFKLSLLGVAMAMTSASAQDTLTRSNITAPPLFSPASSFSTWSAGVEAGVMSPVSFFGKNDFTNWKADFGYGAFVKKQITPAFGIQANFMRGQLEGNNEDPLGNGSPSPNPFTSFETEVNYAGSVSAYLSLANIHWMNRRSVVQPYITAGYGLMGYSISLVNGAGSSVQFNNGDNVRESFIPVGVGLKISLSDMINLNLSHTTNFVDGDNLDGYHMGPQNDKFSFNRIGLEFAIGGRTKPQLATYNPVAALQDDYIAKNAALQAELAAERARNAQRMAQMDTDWKRFLNDADGDGVSDYFDKCPDTPAGTQVDGAGCPIKVTTVNPVRVVVTEEDRRIVDEAIRNLEFDFAKASIRPSSYASLNRVAELLTTKNFSLKLAGHTDNVGSDASNLKLSKDRAESVKSYLVSQGANPSRIEATGYGESQPIATNSTAAGRQKNRRVEFTLY